MSAEAGKLETQGKVDADFVARIHQVVERAGGIAALSRKCRLSRAVIHKYLNGESDPSRTRLIALARAADVSVEWLATGAEPPERNAAATPNQGNVAQPPHSPAVIARRLAALFQEIGRPVAPDVVIDQAFAIHTELEASWPAPEDRARVLDSILAALRATLPNTGGRRGTRTFHLTASGFRQSVVTTVRARANQPKSPPPLFTYPPEEHLLKETERHICSIWNDGDLPSFSKGIRHKEDLASSYNRWRQSVIQISDKERTGGCFGYFLMNLHSHAPLSLPSEFALAIFDGDEAFCVIDGNLQKGYWSILNQMLFIAMFISGDVKLWISAVCHDDGVFDVRIISATGGWASGYAKSGCLLLDDPESETSEALRMLDHALGSAGQLLRGAYILNEPEDASLPPHTRNGSTANNGTH